MDDLYATLGVSRTASTDEINKAYRKLARVHHPDANPDDPKAEQRFKEISHAHDVLSDADKRREYDAMAAFGGRRPNGAGPGAGGTWTAGEGGGFGDFADLFSSIFRGGRAQDPREPTARRGADVEVEVNLSFEQAMAGAQVPVQVETPVACADCNGSGAKPGTSPRLCPECKGRGVRGRDVGSFAFSEPCPRCGGNGTVIDDPCPTCRGTGSTSSRSQIKVKIPPGVKDGTRIRLKGKGQAGVRGGPAGDLQVITRVAPSRLYTRRGDDLVIEVPVTFSEAALGAQVEVPTIDGRVKLRVPPGSADGRQLRLAGKGAPRLKGEGRGALIAKLRVQVPRELSDDQREALERLAALDDGDPRETLFR
jgi:molecular chaperone DnaJ